jgi:hypothetical protein
MSPMANEQYEDGDETKEQLKVYRKLHQEREEGGKNSDGIEVGRRLLLRVLHTLRRGHDGAACCALSSNSGQSHGAVLTP